MNTDKLDSINQVYPDVSISNDTIFVVSWIDYRNNKYNPDIYIQTFDKNGYLYDYDLKINDDDLNIEQYFPAVSMVDDSNFIVCWEDTRSGDDDIYIQKFKSNVKQGKNVKVNDDRGLLSPIQKFPFHQMVSL